MNINIIKLLSLSAFLTTSSLAITNNYIYKDTVKNLVTDLSIKHYFIDVGIDILKQNQEFLFYINKTGHLNYKGKYKYKINDNKISYDMTFLKGKDLKNFVRNGNFSWDKENGELNYILSYKELSYIKLLEYIKHKNFYIGINPPLNTSIIWYYPLGDYTIAQKLYKDGKWYINKILYPEINKNTIILSDSKDLEKLPKIKDLKIYIKTDNGIVLYMYSKNKWKPFTESGTVRKKIVKDFKTFITINFDYAGGSTINVEAPNNEWSGYRTFLKYDSKEGGWWEDKISKTHIIFKNYEELLKLKNVYGNGTYFYFYDTSIKSIVKMKKMNNKLYIVINNLKDLKKYLNTIYTRYDFINDNYYVIYKNNSFLVYNSSKTTLLYNLKFGGREDYVFLPGLDYNNIIILIDKNDCTSTTCNGNPYKGQMIENYFFKFKKIESSSSCKSLNNLTDCYN